jgi:hypothetical protein
VSKPTRDSRHDTGPAQPASPQAGEDTGAIIRHQMVRSMNALAAFRRHQGQCDRCAPLTSAAPLWDYCAEGAQIITRLADAEHQLVTARLRRHRDRVEQLALGS